MHHLDERIVRFNEIDLNWHVNNAQYLVWIEDTVGTFLYKGRTLRNIDLNFVSSAAIGEKIRIQGTHAPSCPNRGTGDPGQQIVAISRHACGSQLVRAQLEWAI
jgi:acyl-ACP thioesterase